MKQRDSDSVASSPVCPPPQSDPQDLHVRIASVIICYHQVASLLLRTVSIVYIAIC